MPGWPHSRASPSRPPPCAQNMELGDTVEEVVVTARLRSETVQDAPISVNVATDEALERVAATSLARSAARSARPHSSESAQFEPDGRNAAWTGIVPGRRVIREFRRPVRQRRVCAADSRVRRIAVRYRARRGRTGNPIIASWARTRVSAPSMSSLAPRAMSSSSTLAPRTKESWIRSRAWLA